MHQFYHYHIVHANDVAPGTLASADGTLTVNGHISTTETYQKVREVIAKHHALPLDGFTICSLTLLGPAPAPTVEVVVEPPVPKEQ